MDPISALGLASNVLQFVHFASGLLNSAQKIYVSASGTSSDCQHLEHVYSRLSQLSVAIRKANSTNKSNALCMSELPGGDDVLAAQWSAIRDLDTRQSSQWEGLHSLARRCDADCQELLSFVAKLKDTSGSKPRWWQCFRTALLELRTQEEVLRIKSRIGDYGGSMTVYLSAIST
jgi:hypothetical protein